MVFNSVSFALFFAAVLAVHSLPLAWNARKRNLLLASYLFYSSWNPPYVVLLLVSTLVDWFAAGAMGRTSSRTTRRSLLAFSLATNLGLLFAYKYGDFLLENTVVALGALGIEFHPAALDLVLPVGISFYTFQSLSYTIDVYRGRIRPWTSFTDFALYVSFFPQLVAGPIVRAREFLPQCATPKKVGPDAFGWGLALVTLGLFEKVVLADALMAPTVDAIYAAPETAGFLSAWLGTLAFSAQIFFDFAGYSTCAIGVAACLGFDLPENFRYPYAAVGFADFWRRWHVSLSTWLRDYVYVSAGGDRSGTLRTYVNVMFTMLVGGLWHGASWSFVVWGGMHGLLLVAERPWRGRLARIRSTPVRVLVGLATFVVVTFTWALFRADDLPDALHLMKAMLGLVAAAPLPAAAAPLSVMLVIAGLLGVHALLRDSSLERLASRIPWWARSVVLASMLLAILLTPSVNRVFIYFQF